MSDLLPLVVATLKDKVAMEAQQEIKTLRNGIKLLTAVEVLRTSERDDNDQVLVYASGCFTDGSPGANPNLWSVNLAPNASCRLSDLRKCRLCVGGGFPAVSFNTEDHGEGDCEGWLEGSDGDKILVNLCFCPYSTWVALAIKGWPDEHDDEELDPQEIIHYLVDDIAASSPEAMVEFRNVSFVSGHIHGALKRLLPPQQRDEALTTHRYLQREEP